MDFPPTWPPALQSYLHSHYGSCAAIASLRGLSHNQVWHITFHATSLIVKHTTRPVEAMFYRVVAPALRAHGIGLPDLDWLHTQDESYWLVLEYIPKPLPRTRWLADPGALALLHRLHQCALPPLALPLFHPEWTDRLTRQALTHLTVAEGTLLAPLLHRLQAISQPLFQSSCWISGDPNAMNWGLRENGSLVLYDWERFGRGTPALDLAISVPGLGDWAAFEQVAERYLAVDTAETTPYDLQHLTQAIALAKVWNVLEFLSMAAAGDVAQMSGVPVIVQQLPQWVQTIATRIRS